MMYPLSSCLPVQKSHSLKPSCDHIHFAMPQEGSTALDGWTLASHQTQDCSLCFENLEGCCAGLQVQCLSADGWIC